MPAKWSMGFVLRLEQNQFRQGIRSSSAAFAHQQQAAREQIRLTRDAATRAARDALRAEFAAMNAGNAAERAAYKRRAQRFRIEQEWQKHNADEVSRQNQAQFAAQRIYMQQSREIARNEMLDHAARAASSFLILRQTVGWLDRGGEAFRDFQYQARGLSALLHRDAGAGEQLYIAFQKLNPTVREFAPTEVVQRMRDLAAAGYEGTEILSAMGAVLNTTLAATGELTTTTATELGINLHRAFGGEYDTMSDLLDVAVAAANQFPMTVGQITDAMGYATEAAVTYKQSLGEVLLTLGMLMPVTKTASKAGTAYRNMVLSLGKTRSIKYLEEWGVSVKDQEGQMRPVLDIYADIYDALDRVAAGDQTRLKFEKERIIHKMGGVRGGAGFAAMDRLISTTMGREGTAYAGMRFADQRAALFAMRTGIAGSVGESRRFADELRDTSYNLRQRFSASVEKASIVLGGLVAPVTDKAIGALTTFLDLFSSWGGGGILGPGKEKLSPSSKGAIAATAMALLVGTAGGVLVRGVISALLGGWGAMRFMQSPAVGLANAVALAQAPQRLTDMQAGATRRAQWVGGLSVGAAAITGLAAFGAALYQAHKALTDFTDITRKRTAKENEGVGAAVRMMMKYTEAGLKDTDWMKAQAGGYAILVNTMVEQIRKGGTPIAAVAVAKAAQTRQIKEAGYTPEEQEKALVGLQAALDAIQDDVIEWDATWRGKFMRGTATEEALRTAFAVEGLTRGPYLEPHAKFGEEKGTRRFRVRELSQEALAESERLVSTGDRASVAAQLGYGAGLPGGWVYLINRLLTEPDLREGLTQRMKGNFYKFLDEVWYKGESYEAKKTAAFTPPPGAVGLPTPEAIMQSPQALFQAKSQLAIMQEQARKNEQIANQERQNAENERLNIATQREVWQKVLDEIRLRNTVYPTGNAQVVDK